MPSAALSVARRGLTLVELAIGLVFTGAVSGVVYRLLLVNHRVTRAQTERAALQDNVRSGILIVTQELRDLGFDSLPETAGLGVAATASGDILLSEPGRIRYRALRGLGFTCAVPAVSALLIRADTYEGPRQPVATVDSISVFVEGDPALASDDGWVRVGVTGVSAGACADGSPALTIATAWESPALGAAAVGKMAAGGPVRVFEIAELQYYSSDGTSWLGMRSVSRDETIQPLVGPLAAFTLGYLDRDDAPTAVPGEVRTVTVTLQGVSAAPGAVDSLSLSTRVTLRNMLRP